MALIGGSVSQLPEADMDMSKSVGHLSGGRVRKVNQLIVFFVCLLDSEWFHDFSD